MVKTDGKDFICFVANCSMRISYNAVATCSCDLQKPSIVVLGKRDDVMTIEN
jgi:hypothetical protein